MDDEERLLRAVAKERRSHQITWFIVLWTLGLFLAVKVFPPSEDAGWLFLSSWLVTFAAWVLSKKLAGITPDDERRA